MKIEIENYKGQSIVYNDDSDRFECDIEICNNVKNTKRSSLNDVRKEIDLFIKLNLDFKPFKFLFKNDGTYHKDFQTLTCIGIRTDGKFIVQGGHYKQCFDQGDMERAMIYDQDIVDLREMKENDLREANKRYTKYIADLYDRLTPMDLSMYKI